MQITMRKLQNEVKAVVNHFDFETTGDVRMLIP